MNETISKLSDYAAVICRQKSAKGCIIVVLDENNSVLIGRATFGATPSDIQDGLCAAICENAKAVGRNL